MTFQHRGGHKRIVAPDGREPTLATKPQPDSGGDREVVRQPDPTAAQPAPDIVVAILGVAAEEVADISRVFWMRHPASNTKPRCR